MAPQPTSRHRLLPAAGGAAVSGAPAAGSTDAQPATPAASRPPVSLTSVYDHADLPQIIGAAERLTTQSLQP